MIDGQKPQASFAELPDISKINLLDLEKLAMLQKEQIWDHAKLAHLRSLLLKNPLCVNNNTEKHVHVDRAKVRCVSTYGSAKHFGRQKVTEPPQGCMRRSEKRRVKRSWVAIGATQGTSQSQTTKGGDKLEEEMGRGVNKGACNQYRGIPVDSVPELFIMTQVSLSQALSSLRVFIRIKPQPCKSIPPYCPLLPQGGRNVTNRSPVCLGATPDVS